MRKALIYISVLFVWACTSEVDSPGTIEPTKKGTINLSNPNAYEGYYIDIHGIKSSELKAELHDIIDDNKMLGYSSGTSETVWSALEQTDEDPNNSKNVILIYTGRSQSKSYKDRGQNDPDSWNREHVWPKSRGVGDTRYKGSSTDIHHIRPADRSVNTARLVRYFDNGGRPHSEATECKYDSNSWEPRDAVKGDIARMLFYMAVRYEGDDGYEDLELSENVSKSGGTKMGKLSVLIEWHKNDPVDEFERNRNQTIFEIQGNRNPFIDFPELVEYIW